ncbi:MAG: hypothetical protein ACFFDT_19735 [Candidatus Hodarchaeota archaeon]
MAKVIQTSTVTPITPTLYQSQTMLVFNSVCGKRHQIDLNQLPASTTRRVQVKQESKLARHFIIHSRHTNYRKILIISEFGD